MRREASITLPNHPASAGDARRFVSGMLAQWGCARFKEPALVLTSECVSNGVVHGDSQLMLRMVRTSRDVRVEVWDANPDLPLPRQSDEDATGGRGLAIVDTLSDRWGTVNDGGRKCVWFEFEHTPRAEPGPRPLDDEAIRDIRDRALVATERSFAISDPSLPGNPLIYVNPAFEQVTGYAAHEAVGRNCRFLQGPGTDPATVAELREAIEQGRPVMATLLNYRKDGSTFWNEVSIDPVLDTAGRLTHFVGVQTNVTHRILAEGEREEHYQIEQRARAEAETARAAAEHAQLRLALLAEATSLLASSLDTELTLKRLARLIVPFLADWCVVDVLDDSGVARRVAVAGADEAKAAGLRELEQGHPVSGSEGLVASVLDTGRSVLVREVTDAMLEQGTADPRRLELYRRLGASSAMVVPLRVRGEIIGAITMVASDATRRYSDIDLTLAEDLGRRAAFAIDNARLYEREQRVAETLQRSLLPEALPEVHGLELLVRYVAGSVGIEVGGDWYDVISLPDEDAVYLVIGDVMGHDLRAAGLMGRVRSAVRAYAIEGDEPGPLLGRLDRLVQRFDPDQLVTLFCGRYETATSTLRYASAGHPPSLLMHADGTTSYLEEGRSVLVGVLPGLTYEQAEVKLCPGDTLLLYTDGLIEERSSSIEAGLGRLADEAASRAGADLRGLCDGVLDAMLVDATRRDDVALLAIRILPEGPVASDG